MNIRLFFFLYGVLLGYLFFSNPLPELHFENSVDPLSNLCLIIFLLQIPGTVITSTHDGTILSCILTSSYGLSSELLVPEVFFTNPVTGVDVPSWYLISQNSFPIPVDEIDPVVDLILNFVQSNGLDSGVENCDCSKNLYYVFTDLNTGPNGESVCFFFSDYLVGGKTPAFMVNSLVKSNCYFLETFNFENFLDKVYFEEFGEKRQESCFEKFVKLFNYRDS